MYANERLIVLKETFGVTATGASDALEGNITFYDEFPFPVTLQWVKACAANDSSATLAVADEDSNDLITAAAIGDSSAMTELNLDSGASGQVAQDKYVKFTLDYDGASGTAAAGPVEILRGYLSGESA